MNKKIIRRAADASFFSGTNLHPLLQRIYAARGVQSAAELEYELKYLLPWHDLLGIDAAASLLAAAVKQQQNILVVGDFDADGATGTAVAVRA